MEFNAVVTLAFLAFAAAVAIGTWLGNEACRSVLLFPFSVFMGAFSGFGTGSFPTLLEVTKQLDPDGKSADIVELLQQTNAPLLDIPWIEGNLPTGHRTTVRTGLPTATWRQFYQGVATSKSTFAQVTDACAMLEARGEVDKALADLNGNTAAFRMNENYAFIEAMNQAQMTALLYGNSGVNPEQFNGLSPRFSALSATPATVGYQNIIDAGGIGSDNTSIWLVCWGMNTVHGIYPKGSKGGLEHEDLGTIDATDELGNKYRAYGDIWKWNCGLTVKDWRYIVRIANVDVSNLTTEQGAADLIKLMLKAMHRVPNLGVVQTGLNINAANGARPIPVAPNPVFYCNRTVSEMLDIQSLVKSGYQLKPGNDVYGRPINFIRGVPIRTCDQILLTESRVV